MSPDQISIHVFDVPGVVKLYVVILPAEKHTAAWPFWIHAGVGVSSRLAADCVNAEGWREVKGDELALKVVEVGAQSVLRERIAGLLERVGINLILSLGVRVFEMVLTDLGSCWSSKKSKSLTR